MLDYINDTTLKQDRFYDEGGGVLWQYFNPDCVNEGGQIVYNHIWEALFLDAVSEWAQQEFPPLTHEAMMGIWDVLMSSCKQYIDDVGIDISEEEAYETLHSDVDLLAIGATEETLRTLAGYFGMEGV